MPEDRPEILVFELGGRRFGLPVSAVRELVRAVTSVPLPLAPAIVEGVVNLRGSVVPVLDLRPLLQAPPKSLEPSDHLILARVRGRQVALRVDRALALATVERDAGDIPVEAAEQGGVARLDDGLVPILDPADFLTDRDASALDNLLSGAGHLVARGAPS